MQITVVGQGYVGLPLALAAVESDIQVIGLDQDKNKVSQLAKGFSNIEDISDALVKKAIESGSYKPTSDISEINGSEIVLICVPTPLGQNHRPDLTI